MKNWLYLFVVLTANCLHAQHAVTTSAKFSANSAELLTRELIANAADDHQKVKSIFRWITDNVAYQVKPLVSTRYNRRYYNETANDSSELYHSLDEWVAISVIKKREAVCDGYARLFKTLCDYAGIRSEVVLGYARTTATRAGQFRSNHKWNAVFLDGKWQLLDVTWASGFISFTGEFIRHYDDFYFLTPPDQFIRDHYPEDLHWTLLSDPPTLREFHKAPFRYSGFAKKRIISVTPATGILEASVGDTLLFQVETFGDIQNLWVTDSSFADTIEISGFAQLPSPPNTITGNKIDYRYVVPAAASPWLYMVFNDEKVLRYKLNLRNSVTDVRKEKGAAMLPQ